MPAGGLEGATATEVDMTLMIHRSVRDHAPFPVMVIAAFATRNAGVLLLLSALAIIALGPD